MAREGDVDDAGGLEAGLDGGCFDVHH